MIEIEKGKFNTLLNYFFSTFFCDDLYENLLARYNIEYENYHDKDKTLDQIFGDINFI